MTAVWHTSLKTVTSNPDKWWRISGILFLISYGASLGSGTTEAAIMLNILHLIVGIPALTLLPRAFPRVNSWIQLNRNAVCFQARIQ